MCRLVTYKSASWSWWILKLTYLKVTCGVVFPHLSCVVSCVCRTTAEGHRDQVVLQTGLLSPNGPGWKSGRDQRRQHQLLWADDTTPTHRNAAFHIFSPPNDQMTTTKKKGVYLVLITTQEVKSKKKKWMCCSLTGTFKSPRINTLQVSFDTSQHL